MLTPGDLTHETALQVAQLAVLMDIRDLLTALCNKTDTNCPERTGGFDALRYVEALRLQAR